MPGAKITERTDNANYKGTVTIRFGPATMSFKGDIMVKDVDAAKRSLCLIGKGSDTAGTSGASMHLIANIESVADGTSNLVGKSEVSMTGKAAAFGGRMMNTVADQILKQFAANFANQVQALQASRSVAGPTMAATTSAPNSELNAFSLLWAIIRDGFRGLFSRKST